MSEPHHTGIPAGVEDQSTLMTTPEDVAALVDLLNSPARTQPVLIVSVSRGSVPYPVAPSVLADELRGVADVYVLVDSDLAWELDSHREYRTYGGAVRIVGSAGYSSVLRTDGEPSEAFDRIVSAAGSAARQMRRLHVVSTVPDGGRAALTADAAMASELETEREKRTKAEQRAAVATRELAAARAEIARLRSELAAESVPLFSDPEAQFRDDLYRGWLRQIAESERCSWPLREFRVGPNFLGSLDIPQAPRAKIIEVVVDVLTRRAYEMTSRSVRAHGDGGPAGVHGQIIREDGAAGYRCNIKANTPQAPRLMWWELTDGTVELALAGPHDEPMPR